MYPAPQDTHRISRSSYSSMQQQKHGQGACRNLPKDFGNACTGAGAINADQPGKFTVSVPVGTMKKKAWDTAD